METAEIKTVMKALTKVGSDKSQLHELLDKLDREIKPTEKLLRETKVGIAVNNFRTHEDSEISNKVKKIIKKWKDEVSAQKQKAKESKQASQQPSKTASPTPEKKETPAQKFTSNGKPRSAANDGVKTDIYDDSTRNKCVELFYSSLAIGSDAPPADILSCAKAVENVVFEGEKGVTGSYRTKMRSLYVNLKDPNNPKLRSSVVSGDISASRLYKMSPQEMASDELKKEMEAMAKDNLFKAQGAVERRAVTNRFTCGKCKHKEVSYYQMQTRSADEPLTTFCTCENCGNRWKFS